MIEGKRRRRVARRGYLRRDGEKGKRRRKERKRKRARERKKKRER